jgi:hypothetical protein
MNRVAIRSTCGFMSVIQVQANYSTMCSVREWYYAVGRDYSVRKLNGIGVYRSKLQAGEQPGY